MDQHDLESTNYKSLDMYKNTISWLKDSDIVVESDATPVIDHDHETDTESDKS